MKKKFSKIWGVGLTIALVASLLVIAAPVSADIPEEGSFEIDGGIYNVTASVVAGEGGTLEGHFTGTNYGITPGPYYTEMKWYVDANPFNPGYEDEGWFWAKVWIGEDRIDFLGQWDNGWSGVITVDSGWLMIGPDDGAITLYYTCTEPGGAEWYFYKRGLIGVPELMPDLALDVKGSIQKFVLLNVPLHDPVVGTEFSGHRGIMEQVFVDGILYGDGLEWWLEWIQDDLWCGNVMPPDFDIFRSPWVILPGVNLTTDDIEVVGGGGWWDPYIEIRAAKPGDCHVTTWVWWPAPGPVEGEVPPWAVEEECIQVDTVEKKWGEISDSDLDVDPDIDGVQHTKLVHLQIDNQGEIIPEQEVIEENVKAVFMWGHPDQWEEYAVGHAIVHWWLFDDTEENQDYIHALMDYLEAVNNGWTAVGDYDEPAAFRDALDTLTNNPFEYIDWLLTHDLDLDGDDEAADDTEWKDEVGGVPTGDRYIQTETEDDWPGEVRGRTLAELRASDEGKVMIVTLAEYPIDYHGENPVAVQIGKKEFKVIPIAQVKTPQVRWAGEKIVLEKDWGVSPSFDVIYDENERYIWMNLELYMAIYSNEEGSIGNLEPIEDFFGVYFNWRGEGVYFDIWSMGLPTGANQVIVPIGGWGEIDLDDILDSWLWGDSTTQCILATEQQGQADVNVALYTVLVEVQIDTWEEELVVFVGSRGPISNHGFLVYFLAFEDVVLAEGVPLDLVPQAGEQIDITPLAGLQGLNTVVDNADVAVQVRGWFTSDRLPGTTRDPVDVDGDGLYDMPAGRYVLPNDWPGLAGYNYEMRPNFDLMDQAHIDAPGEEINSDFELGPYDGDVVTTVPPGAAVWPTIGPFSTLQQWTVDDVWNAGAMVPCSDWTVPSDVRNTVVPDGELNWFDCPMPQALVIFDIVGYNTLAEIPTLNQSNLFCCNYLGCDKGDIEGYGYIIDILPTTFGTATAVGTTTTLIDTAQAWTPGALAAGGGRTVCIDRGGTTFERTIVANTATRLTLNVALPTPTQIDDAYFMKIYQSPFYMAEVPSNWWIPAGYNWNSWWWGIERLSPDYPWWMWMDVGPYDFWTDLFLDSIIANTTEPNQDDWEYARDVEVYSDNLGIAAVTVDALNQFGTVTLNVTAEFPFAPKKGKYPACVSDDITVTWGPPDLNPHFLADKLEVIVSEVVTFENLTQGGTLPYVRAQWDFNGDGIPEIVYEDPAGIGVMDDALWAYDTPNPLGYSVILTMTDSALITRWEERPNYIIVSGDAARKGDFNGDGFIDFSDFVAFAGCYGCVLGDVCYNVIGDFNDDGIIDFFDFVDFAAVYGT